MILEIYLEVIRILLRLHPQLVEYGGGGAAPSTNTIDFITFASTGDATDFGDLLEESNNGGSVSDSTRGVIATGGIPSSPGRRNHINFMTMASTGNAQDFGVMYLTESLKQKV